MSGVIFLVLRVGLALILYAFLGSVLWLLWQDLHKQGQALMGTRAPALVLRVKQNSEERVLRFQNSEVVIGRDPACECYLQDLTISARHARLTYHHSQWWVEDLNSRNGTLLNETPIVNAVVVASGDRLQCGQIEFHVLLGENADSQETPV